MNKLKGIVSKIESTEHIALIQVKVGEDYFSSVILCNSDKEDQLKIDDIVYVIFKDTEVSIGKNLSGGLSMRNRLNSKITSIEKGDVLCKLTLNYCGHTIISVITTSSTNNLNLKIGDQVEGLVKSNEVSILKRD